MDALSFIAGAAAVVATYFGSKYCKKFSGRKKLQKKEFFNDMKKSELDTIGHRLIKNYVTGRNTFNYDERLKAICDECSAFYERNMRLEVYVFRRYNEFSVSFTFYAIGLGTFAISYSSSKVEINDDTVKRLPGDNDEGYNHHVFRYSSKLY